MTTKEHSAGGAVIEVSLVLSRYGSAKDQNGDDGDDDSFHSLS